MVNKGYNITWNDTFICVQLLTVNELTPYDVKVVGALGDSMTVSSVYDAAV